MFSKGPKFSKLFSKLLVFKPFFKLLSFLFIIFCVVIVLFNGFHSDVKVLVTHFQKIRRAGFQIPLIISLRTSV